MLRPLRPPSDFAAAASLFALAVLVRLAFLAGTVDRDLPYSIFYYGDSRVYREYALALLHGDAYDHGLPFHPPLQAWAVAGAIRIVGANAFALRAVLAVVASLVVPLVYLLGRRLWDRRVAWVAALCTTFSFALSVAAVSATVETLYLPLLVGQALAIVLLGDALAAGLRPRIAATALLSGGLLGLGSLARAEHLGLSLAIPIALALWQPRLGGRRVVAASCAVLAVGAIVLAPWTLRNAFALREFNRTAPGLAEPLPTFVPVSSYGPLNFALANDARADGSFRPDLLEGSIDLHRPEHLDLYLHGYRHGLAFWTGHPGLALRLAWRKLAMSSEALALGFGLSNWPAGTAGTRRPVDLFSPDRKALRPIALVLLVAGAWVSRAVLRRKGSVLCLFGLHKVLVCVAFFGYVRLLVHLAPFLFLVQASAVAALVSWLPGRRMRRAVALAGLLVALLLGLELAAAAFSPRRFRASGSADPRTGKLIQDAELRLDPVRSRDAGVFP